MFQSLATIWFVVQWIGLSALKYFGDPKPGPLAQAGIDRAFGPQNQNGKSMIGPDRICQATGHRHGLACHLPVLTVVCFQRQRRGTIPAWGTAPGTHSQIHKWLKARAIPFLNLSRIRIKRLETEPVKGICSPDFCRLI